MFPLILLPIEVNAIVQEKNCKKNTVRALSSVRSKVILTLLTKVITFYIGLTTIYIK